MINFEQIAHDLAIAKLFGSNLSSEEMLEQYATYKQEFLNIQEEKAKATPLPKVEVIKSPF